MAIILLFKDIISLGWHQNTYNQAPYVILKVPDFGLELFHTNFGILSSGNRLFLDQNIKAITITEKKR